MSGMQYQCPGCGYVYDESQGDVHEGFSPGTAWSQVPEEWFCPDCAVRDKQDFTVVDTSQGSASDQHAKGNQA